MYCPAQALASTGATERALERHNLLCPRQDYTRSNLSETITLVESSRLAGLTAGTSAGISRELFWLSDLRWSVGVCSGWAPKPPRFDYSAMLGGMLVTGLGAGVLNGEVVKVGMSEANVRATERYGVGGGNAARPAGFASTLGVLVANTSEETTASERRRR
jgi:hypothetical protein